MNGKMLRAKHLGVAAVLALTAAAAATAAKDENRVVWKRVEMALLRVDDRPPKTWQVYRAAKRKQFLLVQIGSRFLMLDVQARRVSELAPRTLQRVDDGTLEWDDRGGTAPESKHAEPASSEGQAGRLPDKQVLPSADWSMRDVGPMLRIRLRLTEEGRDFDIQVPIQPDLRQFY